MSCLATVKSTRAREAIVRDETFDCQLLVYLTAEVFASRHQQCLVQFSNQRLSQSSLSHARLRLRVDHGLGHTILSRLCLLRELVHGCNGHHIPPHDVLADIPRQLLRVISGVFSIANIEDGVQFLECKSFRLGQQEIAIHSAEQVPASVPAKGAGGSESGAQRWPAEGDDEVEAPASGCRKGHADVANVERESFSRVCERDRAFCG